MNTRMREKMLFKYTSALERGDFETVATILSDAEADSELAQMIREVQEVMNTEIEGEWAEKGNSTKQPAKWLSFSFLAQGTLALVLVAVVTIGVLTLMGPRVGNVFSTTVSSLPSDYSNQGAATAAALPTMVAAQPTSGVAARLSGTFLPAGTATPAMQAPEGTSGAPATNPLPQDRLIIKNGEMDLIVEDTNIAIDQVTQIAADNGGYVLSTQADALNGVKNATMTIAVQASQFDTAMRRLRDIAVEVRREISTGQDVTSEFVDLNSRLTNLEATRDRIRSFLDQAKTVQEALEINNQLSAVEAEIEQVKGRMNYLGGRAAYSTITIYLYQQVDTPPTLTPTPTFTPTPTPVWSLSPTVEKAAGTQVNIVRGLLELAVWIIFVPGPYFAFGLAIFLGVRWWLNRRPPGSPPTGSK